MVMTGIRNTGTESWKTVLRMLCGGSEEELNKAMNILCRTRVWSQVRDVLYAIRIDAYCISLVSFGSEHIKNDNLKCSAIALAIISRICYNVKNALINICLEGRASIWRQQRQSISLVLSWEPQIPPACWEVWQNSNDNCILYTAFWVVSRLICSCCGSE